MSKRLKLSDLAKVVAQKAATSASKGVVISEGSETTSGKRPLDDGSKGKQVAQSLEPKKVDRYWSVWSSREAARCFRSGAATAEKILAGVILPADKEKVDKLTFDQVVTKFIHAIGQGLLSPYAAGILPRAPSTKRLLLNLPRWKWFERRIGPLKMEGALAEEQAKGKKLVEDADARNKVIAKLELAHQYPDLGVDLEDVEMDHEFLAKEEAEAEQRAAEEGAAGAEGGEVYIDETGHLCRLHHPNSPRWIPRVLPRRVSHDPGRTGQLGSTYSSPQYTTPDSGMARQFCQLAKARWHFTKPLFRPA
ncbi:hypothetical protein Acr_18g0009140 [Actinidia rufa]|uniref:Uncharacterized protein n=1 Tax=Actinidia rufa TaxID=165716 RepID=A0A7J0G7G8_9ERIC|nr:hypothetical protein Acr_18g0009140 [Actinidia rufa]